MIIQENRAVPQAQKNGIIIYKLVNDKGNCPCTITHKSFSKNEIDKEFVFVLTRGIAEDG